MFTFKRISFDAIVEQVAQTVRRFPFAIATAFVWAIAAIAFVHAVIDGNEPPDDLVRILLTLILLFPLFISHTLFSEVRGLSRQRQWLLRAAIIVFGIVYYLTTPEHIAEPEGVFVMRYIMWAIGFLLLMTFVPFSNRSKEKEIHGFWHYNVSLALSFILTVFWAGAIMAGLSIAMGSVDFLFNVDIPEERYMELWVILAGIFSPLFFLSRMPDRPTHVEDNGYPKELRLFSQYVLTPLVTLYFVILYAYVARVLLLWEWPKGTLAYMILGFSLLGVLTYVLLYPLRQRVDWVRKAGTAFYIALIPQIGMLFWALWFRISEYAFTENRYFVFVFGWWLLVMAVYFLVSRAKDIRIIPITIFAIALISSFGPWGAFAVSERSQINRLEAYLVANEMLVNGTVQKPDEELPFDDAKEISAIVRYLERTHGLDGIDGWFDADLEQFVTEAEADDERRYRVPELIVTELIGIDYVEQWEGVAALRENFFSVVSRGSYQTMVTDVSDHDYIAEVAVGLRQPNEAPLPSEFGFDVDENAHLLMYHQGALLARIPLEQLIVDQEGAPGWRERDPEDLEVVFSNEQIELVLHVRELSGEVNENDLYDIHMLRGLLMFSLK